MQHSSINIISLKRCALEKKMDTWKYKDRKRGQAEERCTQEFLNLINSGKQSHIFSRKLRLYSLAIYFVTIFFNSGTLYKIKKKLQFYPPLF